MKKKNYVKLVSEETGIPEEICRERMLLAKERYGIAFRTFYREHLMQVHESRYERIGKTLTRKAEGRAERFAELSVRGLDEEAVKQLVKEMNGMGIVKVNTRMLYRYELDRYQGESLRSRLQAIADRQALETRIEGHFQAIDEGREDWPALWPDLEAHYQVLRSLMTETIAAPYAKAYAAFDPGIEAETDYRNAVALDMEMCSLLLKSGKTEYIMFHLLEKDWPERREFLMTSEWLPILRRLNPMEYADVLTEKTRAYDRLEPYYGRKAMALRGEADIPACLAFCRGKDAVVLKPVSGRMGGGIRKLDLTEGDASALLQALPFESGGYILEDLIRPHAKIRKLNPDSVNTVRIVTCYDGREIWIQKCFMKVGRAGSFVDNGGAGGIFVSVDQETGRLNSSGCDERGLRYVTHPENGTRFMGYQLPDWEAALKLARQAAGLIPEFRYIGWDLTYTEEGRWIVVEGNSGTQFLGQQCTVDRGMRKEFLDMVKKAEPL